MAEPAAVPEVSPAARSQATVARIPYLNAQPFYAAWDELPARRVDLVPRRLGQEARAGRVDAGVMAAADFFTLESEFERLGNFAIACRGPVRSVLLFSRVPARGLAGARVHLTVDSSTSAALVRLLLQVRYGLEGIDFRRAASAGPEGFGEAIGIGESSGAGAPLAVDEAWLMIGDRAMAALHGGPRLFCLDLGEAWTEWTGLPFVYAVWAARRALPAATRDDLARFLEASLARGERDLAGIARAYGAAARAPMGSPAELTRYLEQFTYRLGPAEEEGLAAFRRLLQEHDIGAAQR